MTKGKPWRVGIDLGLAEFHYRAPGTAKYVVEQALALFALDVPWQWVPVVRSKENPLWERVQQWNPLIATGAKASIRALTTLGFALHKGECDLAYCPGGLLPISRIPVFGTFFDSSLYEHGNLWSATGMRAQMILLTILAEYALWKADGLFINSEYCKERMAEFKPRYAQKFIVNYPGPPRLPGSSRTPEWARTINGPFVLSAGAFSENKNQRRLILAWSSLQAEFPDLPQLVLAGPSPEEYLNKVIVPLVRQSPRPSEILLPGLISDDELAWCFKNCLFYIHPAIAEGCSSFSNYIAMEMGVAIACADTTSHPEALGDAALFFDPLNLVSIQDAVRKMWRDEDLKRRLVERGSERIKRFTWEKNAAVVTEAFLQRLSSG